MRLKCSISLCYMVCVCKWSRVQHEFLCSPPTMEAAKWKIFGLWRQWGHTGAPRYFHGNAYCTIYAENIWVHLCSEGHIWAWVLQCYYYRKALLPLSSSPPSCSHLILSYITPVSNSILDPEVSSVLASDAIIGFTFVISFQWNNIAVWIDISCEHGRLLKLLKQRTCVHYHWHSFVSPEHTLGSVCGLYTELLYPRQ